jgi:hypothetical protein
MTLTLTDPWFGAKLRAVTNAGTLLNLAAGLVLFCAGCASGPKYGYAQQKDSASIEGPVVPVQSKAYGDCVIHITTIDGLVTAFTASMPGLAWPGYGRPLYLSPGGHMLVLDVGETDEEIGNVGGGRTGAVGWSTAGAKPTVTATFVANHIYRFTANIDPSGKSIDLTLWDETGGSATRSRVANWTVNADGAYTEATPPSGRHR